jgi:serine/threonine protein kinase
LNPDRSKQIEEILHEVLARPAQERDEFLNRACGADPGLRAQVESLILSQVSPATEPLTVVRGSIQPGGRLGHYEILSAIGKGGMGVVWKARDSKLHRDVAIKGLPEAFARDPDRLARLEREAKLLAALNHPNVAAIYGLEEFNGTRFLVLEFVEGETLADRLRHGPVSVAETLRLALQIAESLEAAHEKGIIHRDLKPANIKVTPQGRIKVLDFGLAKDLGSAPDGAPTESGLATQAGVVMGTPSHMSPEQARGETVGRQADIWSFGVVLYDLLTGISPFGRNTTAETLAQVLGTQPDYSVLPADTPPSIQRLIRRCLEKDAKRRAQHIGDVRIEIEDALAGLTSEAVPSRDTAEAVAPKARARLPVAAGVLAMLLLAGFVGWFFARRPSPETPSRPVRLSIPFMEGRSFSVVGARRLAISPDGSLVAYSSLNRLWVRRLDQKDPIAIGPTGTNPFFSPDGKWVGLFRDPGLIKVPVDGGAPSMIAQTSERSGGATWQKDGTIVFATTAGLYQVSQNGGESRLLVQPDHNRGEKIYAWPQFMPDGQSVLFTIVPEGSVDAAQIAVLNLKTLEVRPVVKGGSSAQYVRTGHLVYAAGTTLKAIAFDPVARETRGEPVSFANIEIAPALDNGAADFTVSESGTLLFLTSQSERELRTLQWIDRKGNEEPLAVEPRLYAYPRFSPDGGRVALDITIIGNRDIWILDLERLTQVQLTDGPTEDILPMWSRDGKRVFFASNRAGSHDIYSQTADGATPAKVEFASPEFQAPQAFTADGSRLVVYDRFKDTSILNLAQPDHLEPLLHSEFDERLAELSPDGHWIAYESDESGGQFEIILRSFPNANERREKISINGGRYPLWGLKGSNELYYVNLDGDMMAASVSVSPNLKLGPVTKLFHFEKPPATRSGRFFDLSPRDGRFLVARVIPANPNESIYVSVVLNWLEELRHQTPRR